MAKLIDMTGKTYGNLFVLYRIPKITQKSTQAFWQIRCICGKEFPSVGWTVRSGHTKSCGCLQRKSIQERNAKNTLPKGEAAKNCILRIYKRGAKKRNLEWALSPSDFFTQIAGDCFYCGNPPANHSHKLNQNGDFWYNGVDRLNSGVGYQPQNVVPCCWKCNWMKRNFSPEQFLAHVKQIHTFQLAKPEIGEMQHV